jgi:transcription antitermination factor NusG
MTTWYALQVNSGLEFKVSELVKQIVRLKRVDSLVLSVLSGCRKIVRKTVAGEKSVPQSMYPGYIFVELKEMTKPVWHFLREIPGVCKVIDSKPVEQNEIDHVIQVCIDHAELEIVVEQERTQRWVQSSCDQNDTNCKNEKKETFLQKMIQFIQKGKKQIIKIPIKIYNQAANYDQRLSGPIEEKEPHFILSIIYSLMQYITKESSG